MTSDIISKIFDSSAGASQDALILEIFRYQAAENEVYKRFVEALGLQPSAVQRVNDIPFLPVQLFKSHTIVSGDFIPEVTFSSSGTTGMEHSFHHVRYKEIYEQSYRRGFEYFYGNPEDYVILALLPSYQERNGSSLIYMVDDLINLSANADSGYFLYNHDDLYALLQRLQEKQKKVLLIGVTYALLDFTERYQLNFPNLIVMETGGMKGKRKEMIREELHQQLCKGFGVQQIHSEYGMTELLSQAYSQGNGTFACPPWMRVLIREVNDPLSLVKGDRIGGINIIDMANLHSCSFIATQDLGKIKSDGSFEVSGRFDNSDIRGCNLLVQ